MGHNEPDVKMEMMDNSIVTPVINQIPETPITIQVGSGSPEII